MTAGDAGRLHIERVVIAEAFGGFYNDDQLAIRAGARRDGLFYSGAPRTPGFRAIREPARALSIGLLLSDGYIAWGDAMTVQYSAVAGREPRLIPETSRPRLEAAASGALSGCEVRTFRELADTLGNHSAFADEPPSSRYGLSQALLSAVAWKSRCTMAEILAHEYGLALIARPAPLYAQCGEDRYTNVDKMIARRVSFLPQALINHRDLVGDNGEVLLKYVTWLNQRLAQFGGPSYLPTLHIDVYGCVGEVLGMDIARTAKYLTRLEQAALPYALQIEAVADFGDRESQALGFAAIRAELRRLGSRVKLVVDEWCNGLEDFDAFIAAGAADLIQIKMPDMGSLDATMQGILKCRAGGVGVYLGGSCTETDLSARAAVHVAIAGQVDMLLVKPGMGVDEGYMLVANEQARTLLQLSMRNVA
jgi:methylaspartate ammonia-lyase